MIWKPSANVELHLIFIDDKLSKEDKIWIRICHIMDL